MWDGKKYVITPAASLETEVLRWLQNSGCPSKSATAKEIVAQLKAITQIPDTVEINRWLPEANKRGTAYITMANGILDVDAYLSGSPNCLLPLSPLYFSTVALDYPFDPNATRPHFEKFINEVLEGDQERIGTIQEFLGYSLMPDTSLEKMLLLKGDGANGKSVTLEIMRTVIGHDNVSAVPFENLGDRFQLFST